MNQLPKQVLITLAQEQVATMQVSETLANAFAKSYAAEAEHYYAHVYPSIGNTLEPQEAEIHMKKAQ